MSVQIIRGNALALPLADDSVDLVVTSPPYFGLRSYQDGGEHYDGQIGAEPTPAEFVDALVAATAEMVRVVKPSGSIWVNLGDKYSDAQAQNFGGASRAGASAKVWAQTNPKNTGIPNKSLMGIPWRYAIRCVDELGLILRAEVIWSKPNGLPESVTDRVRRSHEQWFHFTLEPRYYSAVDTIREAHKPGQSPSALSFAREGRGTAPGQSVAPHRLDRPEGQGANPLGKLPGSVWTVPTEPLHVPESLGIDHFAAFPTEWPRRIVQGWSPAGSCTACGEGRRPVVQRTPMEWRESPTIVGRAQPGGTRKPMSWTMIAPAAATITGEVCACTEPTAPTRPGVVLDPFGGTGTTALVADTLGRHGISVDMSADYCRLAGWRTTDPKQRAKAARREYVPPREQTEGQTDLLELLAAPQEVRHGA